MTSAASRFWSKVDSGGGPDACWLWTAGKTSDGYGSFCTRPGVVVLAHRFAYELCTGRSPGDKLVRHTCDTRHCVNPRHLLTGTQADNMADMARRDRGNQKLSVLDVLHIRQALASGFAGRDLATTFGVSESMVSSIKTGRRRQHV